MTIGPLRGGITLVPIPLVDVSLISTRAAQAHILFPLFRVLCTTRSTGPRAGRRSVIIAALPSQFATFVYPAVVSSRSHAQRIVSSYVGVVVEFPIYRGGHTAMMAAQ